MRARLRPALLSFFAALLIPASAADEAAPSGDERRIVPPKPADQIFDDARLLDEAARAEIRKEIQRLKNEVQVELYIAAYTILPGDIDDHAKALRQAWAPGDRSLVMLYRRGAQQLTFSADGEGESFIPSGKLYQIYDDAVAAALTSDEPRQRIVAATRALASGVLADLKERDPKRSHFHSSILSLVGGLVAIVVLIGGISLAVVRRLARKRDARESVVLFPELAVDRRLGGAFGGGTIAEIDFCKAAPSVPASELPPTVR